MRWAAYELDRPIELAGRQRPFFTFKSSSYDPRLVPAGKCVVSSGGTTDWSTWEPLLADRTAYETTKKHVAETCREQIEQRVPGFGARVEDGRRFEASAP